MIHADPCRWKEVAKTFKGEVDNAFEARGIPAARRSAYCVFYGMLRQLYNATNNTDLLRVLRQEWYDPDNSESEGIVDISLGEEDYLVQLFWLHQRVKERALITLSGGDSSLEARYYLEALANVHPSLRLATATTSEVPTSPPTVSSIIIEYTLCVLRICNASRKTAREHHYTWLFPWTEEAHRPSPAASFLNRVFDTSDRCLLRFVEVVPFNDIEACLLHNGEHFWPRIVEDVAVWKAFIPREGSAQTLFRIQDSVDPQFRCLFKLC